MPRKPEEENATMERGKYKMSDETRKEVYGKSEKETAPRDAEGNEERQREYSGASAEGHPDTKGSDKHS